MTKTNLTIIIILIGLYLAGCSSVEETAEKSNEKKVYNQAMSLSAQERHEQAMDHFVTGTIDEVNEDYPSAILEFQDALRFEQTSGIYYALAKNYFYLDKIPFALQNANKSLELDSSNVDYYYLLSDILSSASQFDSAAVVLNKLIKLDSTQANAYYKLARIYENSKPLQAIEIYEKLTDVIGPEWNVLIHVGELYDKMGKLDKAANSIKQLLTIDPGNTSLEKLLAQYYERDKKYDDALKILDEILELNPDDLDARQQKAQVYLDQNDWESASKEYSYILNQPKVPLDAKIRIGVSYFNEALKDSSLFPIAEKFFQ